MRPSTIEKMKKMSPSERKEYKALLEYKKAYHAKRKNNRAKQARSVKTDSIDPSIGQLKSKLERATQLAETLEVLAKQQADTQAELQRLLK